LILKAAGSAVACIACLVQNDCESREGVSWFVNWINEIHRWGLTVHGPSCERDIKYCINSTPGAVGMLLGMEEEERFVDSENEAENEAEDEVEAP
jgi:hypothetical protein